MKDQSQAKQQQQQAAAAAAAQQQQQQESNNESKSASSPQKSTDEEEQDDQPQQQGEEEEQEESRSENEEEVSDEESEEEESDDDEDLEELYQLLVGKKVNKSGMVVDKKSGATIGRLVEGKLKRVSGKKVGENGEIVNDKGKVIGRVEPIRQEDDSEDSASDSEGEEESEQVSAQGDKEETQTTQDDEEESPKNEAENYEDKEEEQPKKEEQELPTEEDTKLDEEDTSKEQEEDVKVHEEDVTEDQEEGDVKNSNEEPKKSDREIADSEDAADKKKSEEEKLDTTENEVKALEVGDDQPAEDAVKSGDTAAVGGAAGVISKDDSKDEEDKPTIDEDSPVVKKSGKVLDMDDNVVGHVDKRMAAKLAGFKVDSEGNVFNDEGEVAGIAEMVKPEEPEEEDKPFNPNEMVDENSPEVKKSGKVVDMEDNIVGSVDKKLAPKLAGFKVDQNGNVINHEGHIVARAEMIKVPDEEEAVANEEPAEKEHKPFNPNDMVDENSPEVRKSGKVLDMDDNLVGHVDKRIAAKYAGCKVDEEGNVIDQDGHVVGRAELIKTKEEPAEEEKKPFNPNELVDEDSPEVRKSGKVFDMDDNLVGHVDKRVASKYAGCKVDPEGNVIDKEGHIVARAEMIKPEEPKEDEDKPFNPYAMVDENSPEVKKSGKVVDMDDNIVGHVDKRIASKLAGCKVDGDGNIINAEGHIAGKAEMIKEEEEDKNKPFNPNTSVNEHSPEVRRSGKVVDEDDNIVGHVDKSAAHKLAGYKVDWDGNIINNEGHIVGKAEMIKQKSEEEREKEAEEAQYRRIADQMSDAIQHSLDKIKPVLKNITDTIEAEEAKSEQDRDEEKLVETVKPLIEQGSAILNEAYGAIRGLDPSGKIAKTAQGKTAERKASPEEYHLAELLSQLTGEVSTTIDKSKKKIKNMPKAKKALSPLWNILQSPLLQILSAVGLLLTGVLGLVGQLLNGLGLGGIINSLLGGIGLNKILEGFGLGDALNLASRKR